MTGHDELHGPLAPFVRDELAVRAPDAAVALLGALLLREEEDGGRSLARVVETEAYREDDPASHSHAKRTTRSEPMFWAPGTSYVYRSYGIHWCLNVAVERQDVGAAVLLRAATVLDGVDGIQARRPVASRRHELLRGPGRLTQGLGIDGPGHDRGDLIVGVGGLRLVDDGWRPNPSSIRRGPRVGVRLAPDLPWRFHLDAVAEVSSYRRSPRAAPPTPTRPR